MALHASSLFTVQLGRLPLKFKIIYYTTTTFLSFQSGKKTVKAVLWVSADGLRVVDDKTKVRKHFFCVCVCVCHLCLLVLSSPLSFPSIYLITHWTTRTRSRSMCPIVMYGTHLFSLWSLNTSTSATFSFFYIFTFSFLKPPTKV